ncbi:MAG: glutaredoxin family protein [Candidatus Omnitrophica bacterium]|nr:glutaredoxin family protein [Candidatus Omnitrophota bacterium]
MNKRVKIYSSPTCPWCHRAKQFLRENNIDFEEFDVTSDPQIAEEVIRISGQMGVPVLDIDGEIVVGFDRERIARLLGL